MSDEARAEAWKRYDGDRIIDDRTGEEVSHDDWGYADTARQAFIAGAEWQASRPFTEEDVEAAAKAISTYEEGMPWSLLDELAQGNCRVLARAALDAVTARHREGREQ